jgi:hypothetical protein
MENRRGRIEAIKGKLLAITPLHRGEADKSDEANAAHDAAVVFDVHSHAHEHRVHSIIPPISSETPLFKGPKLF